MVSYPARGEPQTSTGLAGFLLLYGALYSAYGVESAYMPAFLQNHGLPVQRVGLVLAAGTIVRILSGPIAGRLADHLRARKGILGLCAACSGVIGLTYLKAFDVGPLLAVSMAHAAATAPLAPLSDALALVASVGRRGFQYGWVRGAGSAAFVAGTMASGQFIGRFGLDTIILGSSALFIVLALCAAQVKAPPASGEPVKTTFAAAFRALWTIPQYRRLIFVVVLVIGSHALNDAFAVINWREAGYSSTTISLLWSEAVVAEVAVFFVAGPWLMARLGAGRAAAVSAGAGIIRWTVMGLTASAPALICVQALHGLTFALMHLAAMSIIARHVPDFLAATAQAIYGTFALGIASALLTFASGYLYGWFGSQAYLAMALLCAAALPIAFGLLRPQAVPLQMAE